MDVSVTNVALGLDVPDASQKINSPTATRGVGCVRSITSVDPSSVSGYLFREFEFAFSGPRNRSTSSFTLQEADTSKNMTMNLAELLIGQGLVTRADIDAVRERQLEGGRSGDNLIALALVTAISS
jgi:hypothetical protein